MWSQRVQIVLRPSFCDTRLTNKCMVADGLSTMKSGHGWRFLIKRQRLIPEQNLDKFYTVAMGTVRQDNDFHRGISI